MKLEISSLYDSALEKTIYKKWLESDTFEGDVDERENRYIIMMPFPNITAALHMGHTMDNRMRDLLIRWHRMLVDNILWLVGTDHTGIATQAILGKRLLELECKTHHDSDRDALLDPIWEWKNLSGLRWS